MTIFPYKSRSRALPYRQGRRPCIISFQQSATILVHAGERPPPPMAPVTHALLSWWTANVATLRRRDRLAVFLAGVLPDLDGLGLLFSRRQEMAIRLQSD